jgi:acetyl esterase
LPDRYQGHAFHDDIAFVPARSGSPARALGRQAAARPFEAGTPEEARRAYEQGFPELQGEREPVASLTDRSISVPGGPLTLRIYRGQGAAATGAPALLYLHGGGWVIGNLELP